MSKLFPWRHGTNAGRSASTAVSVSGMRYVEDDTGFEAFGDGATLVQDLVMGSGPASSRRSRNPVVLPPVSPIKTTVTTFQSGHGWTLTGGAGTSNLNDTAAVGLGTQSARIDTLADGTNAVFKSTALSTPLDLTNRHLMILVKIDNLANLSDLRFYCGDSTLANAKNIAILPVESGGSDFNPTFKESDWTWVTVPWALGSNIGTPDRTAVRTFQFRIVPTNGAAATVHVGAVVTVPVGAVFPNGAVSFTYDDGRTTGLSLGRRKLDQYGWSGTAFPIRDRIAATTGGAYVTLQQLQDARNLSGWEIACHADAAADHDAGFSTLSVGRVEADLLAEQQWFYDNNLGAPEGFAWPRGMSNRTVERAAGRVVAYGRCIATTAFNTRETLPAPNRMRIRALSVGPSTTLATLQTAVDFAVSTGTWLVLVFHEIVTTAATSLEANQSVHDGIIDYIGGLASPPSVLPMIDVIRKGNGAALSDASVGGDLSGFLSAPKVNKVNGVAVSNTPTTTGQVLVSTGTTTASWAGAPSLDPGYFVNNRITAGESTMPRDLAYGSASLGSSGQMLLTYFTAEITETITKLVMCGSTTAAGATPTLVRAGVYQIDSSGNGTLLTAFANDTSLFSVAKVYTPKTLTTPFSKTQGQRYAIAILVVSAAAVPNLMGQFTPGSPATWNDPPRLTGLLTAQTDLPASFTDASLASNSASRAYVPMLR